MKTIELPKTNGTLLNFVDYEVDLLLSPPEIRETIIKKEDDFISTQNGKLEIKFKNTALDEGRIKIFICDFNTGKYCLYIYGKIKGKEIFKIKEFQGAKNISASIKNIKIKYVLAYSRNILRTYYLSADTKSIENHLTTFLAPI